MIFPSPTGHWPNYLWPGIIKLFLARESLASDNPAGDGKIDILFLQCSWIIKSPAYTYVRQMHCKKGYRFSRSQPECHWPNTDQGEFGQWHPGWGQENRKVVLQCAVWCITYVHNWCVCFSVDCTGREELQKAQPSPGCPRYVPCNYVPYLYNRILDIIWEN